MSHALGLDSYYGHSNVGYTSVYVCMKSHGNFGKMCFSLDELISLCILYPRNTVCTVHSSCINRVTRLYLAFQFVPHKVTAYICTLTVLISIPLYFFLPSTLSIRTGAERRVGLVNIPASYTEVPELKPRP